MIYGINSHFGGEPILLSQLQDMKRLGIDAGRCDLMDVDPVGQRTTIEEIIQQTRAAGMLPFPIVRSLPHLHLLAQLGVEHASWSNELDGDVWARRFREELDEACAYALMVGIKLWAPAISNLDRDSIGWLRAVRTAGNKRRWPAGLYGIDAHNYGPFPQDGYKSQEEAWQALVEEAQGLPIVISEDGEASMPRGPEADASQANYLLQTLRYWQNRNIWGFFWFQAFDGVNPTERLDNYGIYRDDRLTRKPAAYMFQAARYHEQERDTIMAQAALVISRKDLIDLPGRPGFYSAYYGGDRDRIVSIQPNGDVESRPIDSIGQAYETFVIENGVCVFNESGPRYALLLVD